MATSSSSSVVDLGEAAALDDATSKLFFSNSSAAGPALSWPTESEIPSTLNSQDTIVALCSKHGVPRELTPVCAQDWRACTPPPVGSNKMCVYAAALDAGLRFPLHDFYIKVLWHYQLAPSQLTPNSWSYMAAFVLRCQDAEEAPLVSAFRYFFTICAQRHEGKPTGFHHFQPNHEVHDLNHDERQRRRLFTGNPPNHGRSGWKPRYFFLDCPSGWNCQVEWGKPNKQAARRVQLTPTVIEKLKDMGRIDIKVFLANREMPVGDLAALAPLRSAVKVEAGAAGASAAAVGAAAGIASTTMRKRSRLSPEVVWSQPQPLQTSPALGFARASSTGGSSVNIPPPGLAPIIAPDTGGSRVSILPLGFRHIPPPQQHSLGESTSASKEVSGMRDGAQAVSNGGSSEVTPPRMWASNSLQLWEAITKAEEQAAMIAKLNQELNFVKTWNTQWQEELRAARAKHDTETAALIASLHAANDRNNHLNEDVVQLFGHLQTANAEVARLQTASVEVEQLKAEHALESAQLKEQLATKENRLKEELTYNEEQLKNEGYYMGVTDMMNRAVSMYEMKGVITPDDLKVNLL